MADLKGKTLFITGASRGIGKAIALRAAQDGANIVIGLSVGVSFHHVGEVVVLDPPSPADDGSRQAEP